MLVEIWVDISTLNMLIYKDILYVPVTIYFINHILRYIRYYLLGLGLGLGYLTRSLLLVEVTRIPTGNHRSAASH